MDRNVSRLYLYHGYNYVGYFDVHGEYDMVFHISGDELDYASTMLLKFNDLSTNDKIRSWLSTRVKPHERPDWLITLSMTGVKSRDDWGILLETHCVSYNDTFWWNDTKDTSWYTINHPYVDIVDGVYVGDW